MKIKEIHISQFGRLCDFSYKFGNEVNIIHFENEQGKTTVSEFIRAMLYGFSAGARNIRNNPRKKYMPWGKNEMGGYITVEHNGVGYIITRSFGTKKSADTVSVINEVTGEKISGFCTDCPCKEITGIGAEAFDKALYLNHFSVDMNEKSDEITDRLVALAQSGDEEVSYKRASEILNDAIKELSSSRGGKIIRLKQQISEQQRIYAECLHRKQQLENMKEKATVLEEQQRIIKSERFAMPKYLLVIIGMLLVLSVAAAFVNPCISLFGMAVCVALCVKIFTDKRNADNEKINRLINISKEIGTINSCDLGAEAEKCKSAEETIKSCEAKLTVYEARLADLVIAKRGLDSAFDTIRQGFGTELNKNVGEILAVITGDMYDGVKIDKDYAMTVHCRDGWQSAEYLSDGAYSQIYFALKTAIAKTLFCDMPMIFDDSFALYDEKRRKRALEYLSNCGSQVIFLTR